LGESAWNLSHLEDQWGLRGNVGKGKKEGVIVEEDCRNGNKQKKILLKDTQPKNLHSLMRSNKGASFTKEEVRKEGPLGEKETRK